MALTFPRIQWLTASPVLPRLSEADFPIVEFGPVHWCKKGLQVTIKKRIANSVESDETARHEPSH